METQKSPRSAIVINFFQALLLLGLNIMANKISEKLQLPLIIAIAIAIIGSLIYSVIDYSRNHDISAKPIKDLGFGATISRFIPKTVIGVFPIGWTSGVIIGMITILVAGNSMTRIFNVIMLSFDFFGIVIGLSACLLFAILFDGPLAGGLAFGYGLSFSTGALLFQPFERVYYSTEYYLAYVAGFIVYAIILAVAEPKFAVIRQTITEPRL